MLVRVERLREKMGKREKRNVLQVPRVLHGVARVDDDLRASAGVRDEQDLLVEPEVPAVVRVRPVGRELLVHRLPERGVVGKGRVRRLDTASRHLLALFLLWLADDISYFSYLKGGGGGQ